MDRGMVNRGPKLPKTLLDRVQDSGNGQGRGRGDRSRKERRKAERQEKKHTRGRKEVSVRRGSGQRAVSRWEDAQHLKSSEEDEDVESPQPSKSKTQAQSNSLERKPSKSILRQPKPEIQVSHDEDDGTESSVDEVTSSNISRGAALRGLHNDDDEIAALEKRLGIKGKMKGGAVTKDELDFLVRGSDSEVESDVEESSKKRKRPEDSKWLRDKRFKANGTKVGVVEEDESDEDDMGSMDGLEDELSVDNEEEDEEEEEGLENPFSDDELSQDEFADFSSEGDDDRKVLQPRKRERENPYVAPVPKDAAPTEKYIPPSLRKPPASDDEALKLLRRQVQGQLNRLSEANMLSILQAIESLYKDNPRQYVTSTLIDLFVSLIADPSILNDTFLILHAGFATALYKVLGTDFGAQLLERLVEVFDQYHQYSPEGTKNTTSGKQSLNTIAFLANLYTFQLSSSVLIFDYIRLLLLLPESSSLSEGNTELLLRIIRTSGPQLRQDDPSALKDIVLILQRSVSKIGEANLSIRTKFMIETINNLKNNRMKTGVGASQLAAEHVNRIKKNIGSLNSRAKAHEPLRVGLSDIKDSGKKGRWWLVGASWRNDDKVTSDGNPKVATEAQVAKDTDTAGTPDLLTLARAQGMNTDIRRTIFSTLLSSSDYTEAYTSLLKLGLSSKQELEIPRVLLHCSGAEAVYNPYYTLVAKKLCQGSKRVAKAFRFAAVGVLKQMGEDGIDDNDDDEGFEDGSDGRAITLKKIVNLAKLYGSLIADGDVSITVLKNLDFGSLQSKTQVFVEVLIITVFLDANKRSSGNNLKFERAVAAVFESVVAVEGMSQGLLYFLHTAVENSDIAGGKVERKVVKRGCRFAIEALRKAEQAGGDGFGSGNDVSEDNDEDRFG